MQIIKSKRKTGDIRKLGKSRKPSRFKNLGINKMNLLNLNIKVTNFNQRVHKLENRIYNLVKASNLKE